MANLKSLVARLGATTRNAMEGAAGLCIARTHYEVEVEHLLVKLNDVDDSDLRRVLHHYGINASRVERELGASLDRLKSGNPRGPVLSPHLPKLIERAWLLASIEYGETHVRSGHLLLALVSDSQFRSLVRDAIPELNRIPADDFAQKFADLTADSREARETESLSSDSSARPEGASPSGKLGKTPALDQYTQNMTQRAREGKLDPVLGRDVEIRQMIDILTRRRQNNPILTGEAGVGKTAVVEGLALRIAAGDVPPPLKPVALHALDLTLLQAGASVKGEFENRLRSVIDEVKRSPHPIIVFIDEAHTLIGAGGQAGQGDAANLLKPALARGELRTIAATTWSEYKKYFEKDAALARRFQVVKVEEPSEETAVRMLRGLTHMMEQHHNVRLLDEAVVQAVHLSHRFITGRQLPDKAVSVLDTACARIAIGQSAVPGAIEDARRRLDSIANEMRILTRETATGAPHEDRLAELVTEQASVSAELKTLEGRWEAERTLVKQIHEVRAQLESDNVGDKASKLDDAARAAAKSKLATLNHQLAELQGEKPLVQVCVTGQTIGEVISAWTGIPAGKMLRNEINTVRSLKSLLEERVIGQSHALDAIAQRVRTARANLEDPSKPIGVFMLVGPSGVGKTETALALADILYGGERNLITINMSEYQEAHTVSALKGSPPGYVGYGEGGVLTEAVRRKPYSVVLLDEVEKAHPDVLELFFQVFDKGVLDDSEGREVDFKNTVIILTSNAGTDIVMEACLNGDSVPDVDALAEALRPELQHVFKPAFLGRLKVVPYYPIADDIMRRIIELKLKKIQRRIGQNHGAEFVYDEALVSAVAQRCTEVDSGARNVDTILSGTLLPEISESVLARMAEGAAISKVKVSANASGAFEYAVE